MARGDDLVLKVSADTSAVASGLKPLTAALNAVEGEAEQAESALKELDRLDVSPKVEITVRDEAIAKARSDIDRLRDEIAHGVIMGLDTRAAQRELSTLESSVRKLADKPETVEVDVEVDKEAIATAVEGVDSLREGALGLGEAMGAANGSLTGYAQIAREMVPALADLNETMATMRLRNEAMGRSFGRLGSAVSAVTGVMAGPWGLAIAAGVGLITSFASNMDAADEATKSFAESIDYQAGALDRNNREMVATQLAQYDTLIAAERLGVSTDELVTALLSGGDAAAIMRNRLQGMLDAAPSFSDTKNDAKELLVGFNDLSAAMTVARAKSALVGRAIGDVGDAADKGADGVVAMAGGLQRLGGELTHNGALWRDYDKQVTDARKAVDEITASLDILNGRFVSSREANIGYQKALDDMTKSIKDNGKAVVNHGKAFDTNSEKGRANEETLISAGKALDTLTRARLDDAKGSETATAKVLADYDKQRESLIKTATRMGLTQDAAEDYVDSLLETPKEISTEVGLKGYNDAKNKMNDLTKTRDATVNVKLNVDKYELERLRRRLAEGVGGPGDPAANATGRAAPAVFMSPRLYLDSRPIRAALKGDVEAVVSSTVAATSHRGRL